MSLKFHEVNDESTAFVGYSTKGSAFSIPHQKIGVAKIKREDTKSESHVAWGESDDMPQLLEDMWKKNPDLTRAIQLKADITYASGITYRVLDENNELTNKRIPEVEKFIERSYLYPLHVVNHIYQYFIAFPQLLMNGAKDQIIKIHPLTPRNCRFDQKNADGYLERMFLNGKWDEGATKKEKETKTFRCLDPWYYDAYTFQETWDKKEFSVVFPCALPTSDAYYPTPEYWTLKLSKWYDLAQKIPVFKNAIMENQITIKYLIEMPDWWMTETYPDFEDKSKPEQKRLMKKEVKAVDDFMAGYEKSGKSLVVWTKTDMEGKKYEGWSIKAIDDKMKDGMYVEDSLEATVKIFTAVGVDPGILGITPGKPGSSRSGSERREAFNLQLVLGQRVADVILKPYTFASVFNGWTNENEKVVFAFKKPFMQTLDKITPDGRETTPKENEE
jgi:hypothetical protein